MEEVMKRFLKWSICMFAVFFSFATIAAASDKATPEEVVQKVKQAVQLIEEKGEEAFPLLRDKQGNFVWKDSYLFVMDYDGVMRVHPYNNRLEGRNMLAVKDAKGNLFNAEQVSIAKAGGGWLEYWWVKPNEKTPSQKVSYILPVPGKNMCVGGGLFNFSKDDAEKATN